MLDERLQQNIVNDGDLDTFSDIITNALSRDDWKVPGTAYDALNTRVSEIYEKAMILPMPPIIARLYQICRMFNLYRPRPMTELEIEAEREAAANEPKTRAKQGLLVEFKDGPSTVANCWWEDRGGTDEAAMLVADLVDAMPVGRFDEEGCVAAFDVVGGKFEMLDEEACSAYPVVETVSERSDGIIGIRDGIKRNGKRPGHCITIHLDNMTISATNYLKWGVGYYREKHPEEELDVEKLPAWSSDFDFYPMSESRRRAVQISEIPEVFAIPGTVELVGTKFPSA